MYLASSGAVFLDFLECKWYTPKKKISMYNLIFGYVLYLSDVLNMLMCYLMIETGVSSLC
jgi:hypothetical protein